jgi:Tol biopolymer transport system component
VNVRRLVFVILILLLVLVLVVGYQFLSPRVLGFTPGMDAADLPRQVPITLEFSQEMDPESVVRNLSITPEVSGAFTWEEKTLVFTPGESWDAGAVVRVELATGARSKLGLPLTGETPDWSFVVESILLAYLWPADGPADIYALDPESGTTAQLTEVNGVLDFNVSRSGTGIYFSARNAQEGSDLFLLDRLTGSTRVVLPCEDVFCSNLQVSPDGELIAFERTKPSEGGAPAYPEVWVLLLGEGRAELAGALGHVTQRPQWSRSGLLTFYDTDVQGFVFLDGATGASQALPNQTGEMGTWRSNGLEFVVPELKTSQLLTTDGLSMLYSHLVKYNSGNQRTTDLTGEDNQEDTSPVYSPDGTLLAFGRKYIDPQRWTPGRQIWLMRPDGTDTRQLTNSPEDFKHSAFAWHPNGDKIAYVQFNQTALTDPAELWLINVDGSDPTRLVIGGYSPEWIP